MILDFSKLSIYVRPGITDMRKQINGLSILAEDEMGKDSGSGSLFLFCSRNKKTLKCIYWDKNGFCMWQTMCIHLTGKRKIPVANDRRRSSGDFNKSTEVTFRWN